MPSVPTSGNHRGKHRAPAQRPSRGLALPGAAAALTLTATGAAVVPGLTSDTAAADTQAAPPAAPAVQGDPGSQQQDVVDVRAEVRRKELADAAAVTRKAARERASRAAARTKIANRKKAELAATRGWVLPVQSYRFSSPFGMRWGRLHAGNDFATPIGTPVAAMSSGTVVFAGTQSGYGTKLEIRYWDGTLSWYGHLSRLDVQVGDEVTLGQVVARSGNSGHSTGPHLHLEIHPDGGGPVDPAAWLAERGLRP